MNKLLRLWPLAMIAVLVAMFAASYCGAYFVMQRATWFKTGPNGVFVVRRYSADWQVVLFQPAAKVESMICNHQVQLQYTP
jgi:hypothetical protein